MSARALGPTPRPAGGAELMLWFFMRVSGVVLLLMAVFHLLWMHFVVGLDRIDFEVVARRWENPLWRLFDLVLLAFALSHGLNGLKMVLEDYVHRPGLRAALKGAVFFAAVVFFLMGSYIIVSFRAPG